MTVIEVIDTAVKIGLGALIGGISGLITIKVKNDHELRSKKLDDQRNTLREVALKTEEASAILAEFIHNALVSQCTSDLLANRKMLIDASNASGTAATLANLIGLAELSKQLDLYHEAVLSFHDFIAPNLDNVKSTESQDRVDDLNQLLDDLKPYFSSAYKELYT
ncbi:hypothetical protein [Vibrio parahaemolyticus]|uniref:hypothetical protein n=1 Tax=Vibrio parahaemolyticus TaxID=670 RepID=UPI0023625C68|nr:hypothetical protein [Vibrio parahaemolyticus]